MDTCLQLEPDEEKPNPHEGEGKINPSCNLQFSPLIGSQDGPPYAD